MLSNTPKPFSAVEWEALEDWLREPTGKKKEATQGCCRALTHPILFYPLSLISKIKLRWLFSLL